MTINKLRRSQSKARSELNKSGNSSIRPSDISDNNSTGFSHVGQGMD